MSQFLYFASHSLSKTSHFIPLILAIKHFENLRATFEWFRATFNTLRVTFKGFRATFRTLRVTFQCLRAIFEKLTKNHKLLLTLFDSPGKNPIKTPDWFENLSPQKRQAQQ